MDWRFAIADLRLVLPGRLLLFLGRYMGNRRSKIESLGLAGDVQALVATGLSARRIAARLQNEHPEAQVSESAVTRYVARVRKTAEGEAHQKIKDHVDRVERLAEVLEPVSLRDEIRAEAEVMLARYGEDLQRKKGLIGT